MDQFRDEDAAKPPIYDDAGCAVLPSDVDYEEETLLQAEHAAYWEGKRALPAEKRQVYVRLEAEARRVAAAWEMGLLSPRAQSRLWSVIHAWGLDDEPTDFPLYRTPDHAAIAAKFHAQAERLARRERRRRQGMN